MSPMVRSPRRDPGTRDIRLTAATVLHVVGAVALAVVVYRWEGVPGVIYAAAGTTAIVTGAWVRDRSQFTDPGWGTIVGLGVLVAGLMGVLFLA